MYTILLCGSSMKNQWYLCNFESSKLIIRRLYSPICLFCSFSQGERRINLYITALYRDPFFIYAMINTKITRIRLNHIFHYGLTTYLMLDFWKTEGKYVVLGYCPKAYHYCMNIIDAIEIVCDGHGYYCYTSNCY